MTRPPLKIKPRGNSSKTISDDDVARFLARLAVSYRDKKTGNPELAIALLRVASKLKNACGDKVETLPKDLSATQPELKFDPAAPLDQLKAEDVTRFARDYTKTKAQLVELAIVRFGIPRSVLSGQTIERVRQTLAGAVQHEASIAAIGAEAERYGARRRS